MLIWVAFSQLAATFQPIALGHRIGNKIKGLSGLTFLFAMSKDSWSGAVASERITICYDLRLVRYILRGWGGPRCSRIEGEKGIPDFSGQPGSQNDDRGRNGWLVGLRAFVTQAGEIQGGIGLLCSVTRRVET